MAFLETLHEIANAIKYIVDGVGHLIYIAIPALLGIVVLYYRAAIKLVEKEKDAAVNILEKRIDLKNDRIDDLEKRQHKPIIDELDAYDRVLERENLKAKEREDELQQQIIDAQNSGLENIKNLEDELNTAKNIVANLTKDLIRTASAKKIFDYDAGEDWKWKDRQVYFDKMYLDAYEKACQIYANQDDVMSYRNKLIKDKVQELSLIREHESYEEILVYAKTLTTEVLNQPPENV